MKTATILATTALIGVLTASTLPASADPIDRIQANQSARIQQGVRDGSLTKREAQALFQEQRRIGELEREAKRDGILDPRERARIANAQNGASTHIYQERHDNESIWSRWFGRSNATSTYQEPRRRWFW